MTLAMQASALCTAERDLHALVGETGGVAGAVTFDQRTCAQFAQVIAQLVQAIAPVGQPEAGKDNIVKLLSTPAADGGAGMQQHLHEANDAGVVELDAGILRTAHGDGHGQALQQREVDLRVQAARLEGGEALGDAEEVLAQVGEVFESLSQSEVCQIVRAVLVAQEDSELLILLDERVLPVGTQDVMPVLELFERGVELVVEFPGDAFAEDLGDLVDRQAPQPELATALEDLVDREVALEDEVAAILDLADGVEATQADALAFLAENFGPSSSVQ